MSQSPCTCGDLYCGSCGNPVEMAREEAITSAIDRLSNFIETPIEAELAASVGIAMIQAHRAVLQDTLITAADSLVDEEERAFAKRLAADFQPASLSPPEAAHAVTPP